MEYSARALGFIFALTSLSIYGVYLFTKPSLEMTPDAKLPFMDYCAYYSYPVESHRVTTSDGYILTVFRIQAKYSKMEPSLPPILLQHGLLDSSDTWIINDESMAPAFYLANRGYDVWLGNNRGNKHSREHVSYNPDKDADYWKFSWQEMGEYDAPAVLEYISNVTKFSKVDYMGHSQGTTQMFAALAIQQPTVYKYLGKFIALGPAAYVYHQTSPVMSLLADSKLKQILEFFKVNEFLGENWMISDVGTVFCSLFPKICGDMIGYIADADPNLDNYDRYDVLTGHAPSGTSVQNMIHWQQLATADFFRKFDYGEAENIKRYGTPTPPSFNITNITHKANLFAGDSDRLADPMDVNRLKDELGSNLGFYKMYNAGHCTFVWGKDMSFLNDVVDILESD